MSDMSEHPIMPPPPGPGFGYPPLPGQPVPPPPPPKQRPVALLAILGGAIVVIAAVLVTGLAWPGWMNTGKTSAGPTSPVIASPANSPTTAGGPTPACSLVPISQVEQVLGIGQLTSQAASPIYDPVTGTPSHMCKYADSTGTVIADISVADYPGTIDANQLMAGVASTGTNLQPVPGVADAAGTVSDLGKTDNTGLIAINTRSGAQHLILIVVGSTANPTVSELSQLAKIALNAP